jgi:hypothetical protein
MDIRPTKLELERNTDIGTKKEILSNITNGITLQLHWGDWILDIQENYVEQQLN